MPVGDYDLTPENILKRFSDFKKSVKRDSDPFRPQNLEEYIGQKKAKKIVSIIVQAALKDGRPLPSTLISGSFGQGKSSLARIMADMYDPKIPLIDAASVNKNPLAKGIHIIDEIHNLGSDVCDSFNILLDNHSIHIIGATTNPGALPSAFRSRFRDIHLESYTDNDIQIILNNVVSRKGLSIDKKALTDLAHRSRQNPRFGLNYLAFAFDLITIKGGNNIGVSLVKEAFQELGVDKNGFLSRDFDYINALPKDGSPVGLQYLSAVTSIDAQTLEWEVEPYLLQQGIIDRTPKGRRLVTEI